MKAAICERYGPPEAVRIGEVPTPVPGPQDVLVRVHATTVNSGDCRMRALDVPAGLSLLTRFALGFTRLKQPVFGFDAAGDVAATGEGVKDFAVGDRVLASRGFEFGCHAEYFCVPANGPIARIPESVGYEEIVSICFGGLTALNFFSRGKLKAGESILINGASGAVGVASVQIARQMGAKVTGVCSARNADLVRSLGADEVIDYRKENFMRSGQKFDLIMDTHGNAPFRCVKHMLKPGGRYLMVIGTLLEMLGAAFHTQIVGASENDEVFSGKNFRRLVSLVESGDLRPVIDSTYAFDQIAAAHRRVDGGHKSGSVVVTLSPPAP
ncbi:MAG TPA: NAD(P)-dependent alcohol dehydrogenase [Devosiaceae bacterium]